MLITDSRQQSVGKIVSHQRKPLANAQDQMTTVITGQGFQSQ